MGFKVKKAKKETNYRIVHNVGGDSESMEFTSLFLNAVAKVDGKIVDNELRKMMLGLMREQCRLSDKQCFFFQIVGDKVEIINLRPVKCVEGEFTADGISMFRRLITDSIYADYSQEAIDIVLGVLSGFDYYFTRVKSGTVYDLAAKDGYATVVVMPDFAHDDVVTAPRPSEELIDKIINYATCIMQDEMKPFNRKWANGKFVDERLNRFVKVHER